MEEFTPCSFYPTKIIRFGRHMLEILPFILRIPNPTSRTSSLESEVEGIPLRLLFTASEGKVGYNNH